ncbi:hypothetical protein [Gracilibacillus suaedae]|uniref:hypothetical protein n=1 Tax=Gracilibacillus suaedae TaxID=2820273 RepID=UPI001ABDA57F|nr:hypothetical protein [Gracilibacillus suaedae]
MKIIPIYTESKKNQQGHTIFIDEHTEKSYKALHKESNQWVYWIGFFAILAIMRSIQSIHIPLSLISIIIIFTSLLVLTVLVSRIVYKHLFYEEVKEIYLTNTMIEKYIEDGKSVYKMEVWIAILSFLIFVILTIIFFINLSLVILIFSIFLFFIFCLMMKRLPLARIKLYHKGK